MMIILMILRDVIALVLVLWKDGIAQADLLPQPLSVLLYVVTASFLELKLAMTEPWITTDAILFVMGLLILLPALEVLQPPQLNVNQSAGMERSSSLKPAMMGLRMI